MSETDLQHRLEEASRDAERLRAENEQLRTLLALERQTQAVLTPSKQQPRAAAQLNRAADALDVHAVDAGWTRREMIEVNSDNEKNGKSR